LNKLAVNFGFGRNWAGIHWRSDASASMAIGEEVAIGMLKGQAPEELCNEWSDGGHHRSEHQCEDRSDASIVIIKVRWLLLG
jgi:hypothetical protein